MGWFTVVLEFSDIFQCDFRTLKAFQYTVAVFPLFPKQINVTFWKSLMRICEHYIIIHKAASVKCFLFWGSTSFINIGYLIFPFANSVASILYHECPMAEKTEVEETRFFTEGRHFSILITFPFKFDLHGS